MKFNGRLQANFLGHGPYEKKIKYRWELTAPLSFTFDSTEEDYQLLKNLGLEKTNSLSRSGKLTTVTCPKGFITDLGSISRGAWFIISPWDIARAAVIHDLLYKTLRLEKSNIEDFKRTKELADIIFKKAMETADPKIPNWKIEICYRAVKFFGKYTFE